MLCFLLSNSHGHLVDQDKVVLVDISSAQRQKGLTGYCFKYIHIPFCHRTNDMVPDICTTHPRFDPAEVQTHYLQSMTVYIYIYIYICHVTETPALTTWPSICIRDCFTDFTFGSATCIVPIFMILHHRENSIACHCISLVIYWIHSTRLCHGIKSPVYFEGIYCSR